MYEDRHAQALRFLEKTEKLCFAQRSAVDMRQDLDSTQAECDDIRQLARGQVRILKRHAAQTVEPTRLFRTQRRHELVDMPRQAQCVGRRERGR